MITFADGLTAQNTYNFCYIYLLCADGVPFYVGSSKNPVARYAGHVSGRTKNTRRRIARLLAAGKLPEMKIVDFCQEPDRLHIEARWIALTPEADNTTRYAKFFQEHITQPRPCFSEGTLTAAFPEGGSNGN